jgi:hypothetical protein
MVNIMSTLNWGDLVKEAGDDEERESNPEFRNSRLHNQKINPSKI